MKSLLLFLTIVLFSFNANAEKEDFKQWTCYEHFGDDAKVILEIGYYPHLKLKNISPGVMKLKTNDQNIFVFHKIDGTLDRFSWANNNEDLKQDRLHNTLTISPGDGKSWVFDFSNIKKLKKGESIPASEILNCKDKKTIKSDTSEFMKLMGEVGLIN